MTYPTSGAAVPARVGIVLFAYLTLSGMINAMTEQLPRLSGSVWPLELGFISRMFVLIATLE